MASRRRKKQRDPGVITTQVDMSSVYKNNQAEDKKLENVVIRLKKKENLEVVKCFSEIKHLHRQLADMNLEKDSMTHTFTEEELDGWEKLRRRKFALPKMAAEQRSSDHLLHAQDLAVGESGCLHTTRENHGVDAVSKGKVISPRDHAMDRVTEEVSRDITPLSRRASTVATTDTTASRNRPVLLQQRHALAYGARIPTTNAPGTCSKAVTTPRTSGPPLTRSKSCRVVISRRHSSFPAISDSRLTRSSSLRRRPRTAFSMSSTMYAADEMCEEEELSSSAPAQLQAIKQDISSRNVDLMERIHDFLDKVSPNEKPRKKRRSITKIYYPT